MEDGVRHGAAAGRDPRGERRSRGRRNPREVSAVLPHTHSSHAREQPHTRLPLLSHSAASAKSAAEKKKKEKKKNKALFRVIASW